MRAFLRSGAPGDGCPPAELPGCLGPVVAGSRPIRSPRATSVISNERPALGDCTIKTLSASYGFLPDRTDPQLGIHQLVALGNNLPNWILARVAGVAQGGHRPLLERVGHVSGRRSPASGALAEGQEAEGAREWSNSSPWRNRIPGARDRPLYPDGRPPESLPPGCRPCPRGSPIIPPSRRPGGVAPGHFRSRPTWPFGCGLPKDFPQRLEQFIQASGLSRASWPPSSGSAATGFASGCGGVAPSGHHLSLLLTLAEDMGLRRTSRGLTTRARWLLAEVRGRWSYERSLVAQSTPRRSITSLLTTATASSRSRSR